MEVISENPFLVSLVDINKILIQLNTLLSLKIDSLYLHYVSDENILSINKQYLNHEFFTDIITFDLRDDSSNDAEIYISIERVRENAKLYSVSEEEELSRVCIHGMLHLSGIGDKTDEEQKEMRELENKYLKKLFHVKP